MQEEKQLASDDMELLRFNYSNLHEAVWNAHRVAWTVTSIFVPILFTLQGYLIKEYGRLSTFQVVMGAFVTELLVVVWWLMMRILRDYNLARIRKLQSIEDAFNEMGGNIPAFQQYKGLDYTARVDLGFAKPPVSPTRLYGIILVAYTVMNVVLASAHNSVSQLYGGGQ